MPQFTKQIQKWQNFYSRSWLTRIFWGCLGSTVQQFYLFWIWKLWKFLQIFNIFGEIYHNVLFEELKIKYFCNLRNGNGEKVSKDSFFWNHFSMDNWILRYCLLRLGIKLLHKSTVWPLQIPGESITMSLEETFF